MDRLESMTILLEAVDAGSLSAAGRRLHIPLATVSRPHFRTGGSSQHAAVDPREPQAGVDGCGAKLRGRMSPDT